MALKAEYEPLTNKNLRGQVIVPVLPLSNQSDLASHCRNLREAGASFLLVNGLTGGSRWLNPRQRRKYAEQYVEAARPRYGSKDAMYVLCCLQYPTGENNKQIVRDGKFMQDIGVDALVVPAPLKAQELKAGGDGALSCLDGLLAQLEDAGVAAPLLVYDNPRVSYPISIDTAATLADRHKSVIGYKNSGSVEHTGKLVDALGDRLMISHADEKTLYEALEAGAHSIAPSMANLIFTYFSAFMHYIRGNEWDQAKVMQEEINGFIEALYPGQEKIPSRLGIALYWHRNIGRSIRGIPTNPLIPRKERETNLRHIAQWRKAAKKHTKNELAALRFVAGRVKRGRKITS
ncbi:dihydrodipicolinate synthase family protein [Candidatus Woesearchaeota archaeon]|nr:dihydrodipicolinate synthase family protein [Candidatus Woesearchaeota archaeon]